MQEKVNILISIDDNYIMQAKCLLYSLKLHNQETYFNIYLFYENITNSNLDSIESFVKNLNIGKINKYYFSSKERTLPINIEYIGKETYFRLYAPFYIKEKIDRLLYLDCDIICNGKITELYKEDFENNIIIGCQNMLPDWLKHLNQETNIRLDLPKNNKYINAGVLLIDINKYKKMLTIDEINKFIDENKDKLLLQDQDVINKMFYKKIKIIDTKYNYQISESKSDINKKVILFHYSTKNKPWEKNYFDTEKARPYRRIYKMVETLEKEKLIDIIIPVYNSSMTLKKTLSSINSQLNSQELRVYIIDDCSTESYDEIINYFEDSLDINYYKLSTNKGPGYARRYGMSLSNSKYIIFIDSDDLLYSTKSLQLLLNNIEDYDVVRSIVIKEESEDFEEYIRDNLGLHGKLYRRKFLEENNIQFNNKRSNEDVGFNTLVDLSGAKYKDIFEKTYIWCNNPYSITRNDSILYQKTDYINYSYNIYWAIKEAIKNNDKYDDMLDKIVDYLADIYRRIYYLKDKNTKKRIDNYSKKIYEIIKSINKEKKTAKIIKEKYIDDFYKYYTDLGE